MWWKTEWWKSLPQKGVKRIKRIEYSIRDPWDNINTPTTKRRREREKHPDKTIEVLIAKKKKKIPNMGKETFIQFDKAQRIPYRINPMRNTERHILIKLIKIKDKDKY